MSLLTLLFRILTHCLQIKVELSCISLSVRSNFFDNFVPPIHRSLASRKVCVAPEGLGNIIVPDTHRFRGGLITGTDREFRPACSGT